MRGPKVPSPERGTEERSTRVPKGVGYGERHRSPSTEWGSGGIAQKIFEKSTLNVHIFLVLPSVRNNGGSGWVRLRPLQK